MVQYAESAGWFEPSRFAGAELFSGEPISLRIDIAGSNLDVLRKESREFVPATVTERGHGYPNVAVHLKGSVGSFRPINEKPSFTLDFARFNPGQQFHALRRIHLNNSVEDPTYCNEALGSALFHAAGVPAPRVTRAVVTLNGRRLGLYVLKEGFTEDFLACYFTHPSGNLYEPDEGHDVNQRLKRNSVRAPRNDRAGLHALAGAVLKSDPAERWEDMQKLLNLDEFLSFMTMEIMICHRDGYCLARNNFRVYEDADKGQIMFFPHGMDQLWGNPSAPWRPQMAGLVARALIETPEGKSQYRQRLGTLVTNLLRPDLLERRVDQLVTQLRPVAEPAELRNIQQQAALLKQAIVERRSNLDSQLSRPEPGPLAFIHGAAGLTEWTVCEKPSNGSIELSNSPDGFPSLHILTRSEVAASWRTKVLLNRGRYRFEAKARVSAVNPLPFGIHQGAGLRIGGQTRQSESLLGQTPWRSLQAEFQIDGEETETELICELRASSGEAWFDLDSLRLVQVH